MVDIILQKFANREVRFGVQQFLRPGRNYGDKAEEKAWNEESHLFALSQSSVVSTANMVYQVSRDPSYCALLGKPQPTITCCGEDNVEPVSWAAKKRIDRALDITDEFQRRRKEIRKRRKRYDCDNRPTLFTRNARHRILEGGAVAERWRVGEASTGYFITLTLPGSTPDALRTLARWSGYVCNRLTQYIRRNTAESIWFYTWEWQKRGALHLHLYLKCESTERGVQIAIDLVGAWYKTLEDISRKSGVDLFVSGRGNRRVESRHWQYDVRPVTYGSAAAYVSKYVGKSARNGSDRTRGFDRVKQLYYPARWWGMSRNLKELTDAHRTDVSITGLTSTEAHEVLGSLTRGLLSGECLGVYSYDFEVYTGGDSGRLRIGAGTRWIQYYPDDEFSRIGVWLAPWLRYILAMYPNASMQYKYGNPLHPCKREPRIFA